MLDVIQTCSERDSLLQGAYWSDEVSQTKGVGGEREMTWTRSHGRSVE